MGENDISFRQIHVFGKQVGLDPSERSGRGSRFTVDDDDVESGCERAFRYPSPDETSATHDDDSVGSQVVSSLWSERAAR